METSPLKDTDVKSLAVGDKASHPLLANTTGPRLGLGKPWARRMKLVSVAMGWLLFSVLFMHGLGLLPLVTTSTEQPRAGGDPSSPWGFDWFSVCLLSSSDKSLYAHHVTHSSSRPQRSIGRLASTGTCAPDSSCHSITPTPQTLARPQSR